MVDGLCHHEGADQVVDGAGLAAVWPEDERVEAPLPGDTEWHGRVGGLPERQRSTPAPHSAGCGKDTELTQCNYYR